MADCSKRMRNFTLYWFQGGDADANAAAAGAVLGCKLGLDAIPKSWIDSLLHRTWLDSILDGLVIVVFKLYVTNNILLLCLCGYIGANWPNHMLDKMLSGISFSFLCSEIKSCQSQVHLFREVRVSIRYHQILGSI